MTTVTYYTDELPGALYRWKRDGKTHLLQKWSRDDGSWLDHPDLISACGIGGTSEYQVIPEDVARAAFGATFREQEQTAWNTQKRLSERKHFEF